MLSLAGYLPIVAKVLPWAIAALAITFGLYERSQYYSEKAARAADNLAAVETVRAYREADAARAKQIQDDLAAELTRLRNDYYKRTTDIAAAPVTNVCAASPAFNSLFSGLRDGNAAGSSDKGSTGRTR